MDSLSDHDRFVEQFVRSQDRVYAYIVTLLPNRTDAEEVFQQTSLALWKKWPQYDPARDFIRWACGMAHLEVAVFLRKRSAAGASSLSEDVLVELAYTRLDMQDSLEARRQALRDCLEKLQRQSRELLERCYAGKDTIRDIAQELGIRPNALYMTLKRLRRTLLGCINNRLVAEGRR
jgi:RNA polymerase sigma-70 factor (ECF subfamily)